MFSLQQLFGKGDKFSDPLEAAAQEAHESVRLTHALIQSPGHKRVRGEIFTRAARMGTQG